jgi:antitoxin YefM
MNMPKAVSYSDARDHLKTHLDYVVNNSQTLVIVRKNGDDVVMMARKDYESLEETLYLLSSPKNRKHLLSVTKNKSKGKRVTLKSQKEIDKFFAGL